MSMVLSRKELLEREYTHPPLSVSQSVSERATELNSVISTELTDEDRGIQRALELTKDLMHLEKVPIDWYEDRARKLGESRYLGLASDARSGYAPKKLFSYVLKRAV